MNFKNLTKVYPGAQAPVWADLAGTLKPGKVTMLLGQNGAGKTTLLEALAGLTPVLGTVTGNESVYFLPTENRVYDYMTGESLLALAPAISDQAAWDQVGKELELEPLLGANLEELSSGQAKRVWLAYALLQGRESLLLDEPLAFLDLKYQAHLLDLVKAQAAAGKRVLLSVHDLAVARRYADEVWLLNGGKLEIGPASQMLTKDKVQAAFGVDW